MTQEAAGLYQAGRAASDDGRPGEAVRRYRAALRLAAEPELRGRILISLAWAESERGHLRRGFRLLDEAEPLLPAHLRGILYGQRALLCRRSGRYDDAFAQYDAAVTELTNLGSPLDLVKVLSNRSLLYLDVGRVGPARADLTRAARIAERNGIVLQSAIITLNLGCLDVLAGDLPSALRAFTIARRGYEVVAPGRLANLAFERAKALLAAGLVDEADAELATAIDRASEQQLSNTVVEALLSRAEAALLGDRPEVAVTWARQARSLLLGRGNARRAASAALLQLRAEQAAGTTTVTAASANALAERLQRLGLPEDARIASLLAARILISRKQLKRASGIVEKVGPSRQGDRLDTRLLRRITQAELALASGRSAERYLTAGMTTLHRHRSQFGSLDLQTGASALGGELVRTGLRQALASGSVGAIYRWSERARAQALLLPSVRPSADAHAAAALEELRQLRYNLRQAELAGKPVVALRKQAVALERITREHSWSAAGTTVSSATPVALGRVRSELRDSVLLSYLRDGDALLALVISGSSASVVPVGSFSAASEAVLRLRADLDASAGRMLPSRLAASVAASTGQDADEVARLILEPVLRLVGDRELVVVPTGVLVTVPWAALAECRQRAITVAPSATAWIAARERVQKESGALLVAGPGNDRGEPEVRAIAAMLDQPIVLTGEDATPAATLAAFDQVTTAHLAVHGRHRSDNALFSSLELSGGPLLGYDLQQVERPPATVILSACDLGLADVRPGDETIGMATALLSAGSATVIASVSRIADEVAMATMTRFHEAIAAGAGPAAALASAVPAGAAVGFVCLGSG